MMHHLVYVSTARPLLADHAILEIVRTSARNNAAAGVTGMLVYCDGNVVQALEGDREAVETLFHGKIKRDRRHRDLMVVCAYDDAGRDFEDWSMAYFECGDTAAFRECVETLTAPREIVARLGGDRPAPRILLNFARTNARLVE